MSTALVNVLNSQSVLSSQTLAEALLRALSVFSAYQQGRARFTALDIGRGKIVLRMTSPNTLQYIVVDMSTMLYMASM
jgi:beta-lactamase superfamily II metal-dependent hydrolase